MKRRTVICLLVSALLAPQVAVSNEPAVEAVEGKPALIVMDIQNAYFPYMDEEEIDGAMQMINATIDLFRAQGLPIIRVYHTDETHGPVPGSEPFAFPETVRVQDDDTMVVKNYPSAFKKTELEKILAANGADTVFLTGLSATGCVLATYFDAVGLELQTFMVEGALISHDAKLTRSVEEITGAVGYKALKYMVENAPR